MDAKREFVQRAMADAQAEIRDLELKAGLMLAAETIFLALAVASAASNPMFALLEQLQESGATWYAALIVALFIVVAAALIGHIWLTLRILLPVGRVERYVDLGGTNPARLYTLRETDPGRRIVPSVPEYGRLLGEASEEQLADEYVLELQQRSWVRKVKGERLTLALLLFGWLIGALALYGLLVVLAGIIY